MPDSTRTLTLDGARELIRDRSFADRTGRRIGVELEWFTTPSEHPHHVRELDGMLRHLEPLPGGSVLSYEPGAQVELSSAPLVGCGAACEAIAADTEIVRRELGSHGITMFATGVDSNRSHELRTDAPRYVAIRKFFDRYGPSGARMMCATGSIHLNVDGGRDEEGRERWRAAHILGPTLIAAFANSPLVDGAPSGWKSSRYDAWRAIDPTRTSPAAHEGDPADDWADYAMAAQIIFIRTGEDRFEPPSQPITLARWVEEGDELGYPDAGDVEYHLTTLYPAVRPRGYFEVRVMDMLPHPWWRAAVAVATAVITDPRARSEALEAAEPTTGRWEEAARFALDDENFRTASRACFEAASGALERIGCDEVTAEAVEGYNERFVLPGRTPADDVLDLLDPPVVETP